MADTSWARLLGIVAGVGLIAVGLTRHAIRSEPPKRLDPSAWGSDHVGKPVPRYMTGDECLFCHRKDVGPTWADNRHNLTIREADPKSPALVALAGSMSLGKFADQVTHTMGHTRQQRFLRTSEKYGRLELLSVKWSPDGAKGKLVHEADAKWETATFAKSCAGCHTTAVNPKTHAFSALALDCYTCHGDVPFDHTKKPALVHLGKARKDPARVAVSVCASCHVRTGTSKRSGLPYPTNFVAGDNLFRDFGVDLSPKTIGKQNPADAHVLDNIRDVVVLGKNEVTCVTCHDIHKQSSTKHHRVAESDYCLHCHNPKGSKKIRKTYDVHSTTCQYGKR